MCSAQRPYKARDCTVNFVLLFPLSCCMFNKFGILMVVVRRLHWVPGVLWSLQVLITFSLRRSEYGSLGLPRGIRGRLPACRFASVHVHGCCDNIWLEML